MLSDTQCLVSTVLQQSPQYWLQSTQYTRRIAFKENTCIQFEEFRIYGNQTDDIFSAFLSVCNHKYRSCFCLWTIQFEIAEAKLLSWMLRNHFGDINSGCSAIGGQSQSNYTFAFRLPALLLSGNFSVTSVITRNVAFAVYSFCSRKENGNDNKLCKLLMKCTHNFLFESCFNGRLVFLLYGQWSAYLSIYIYLCVVCTV